MKEQKKITVLVPKEKPIQPCSCGGSIGSFGGTAVR